MLKKQIWILCYAINIVAATVDTDVIQLFIQYSNSAYCLSVPLPAQVAVTVAIELCQEDLQASEQMFMFQSSKLMHSASGLCVTKSSLDNHLELVDCSTSSRNVVMKDSLADNESLFRLSIEPNIESCFDIHNNYNAVHSIVPGGLGAESRPYIFYFGYVQDDWTECLQRCYDEPDCDVACLHTMAFGGGWAGHCYGRSDFTDRMVLQDKMMSGTQISMDCKTKCMELSMLADGSTNVLFTTCAGEGESQADKQYFQNFIHIDECGSNPCVHGSCNNHVNSYSCSCDAGNAGTNCEIDTDECASNPCVEGTCNDGVNQFTCICNEGYGGPTCATDIDECASNPCVEGTCNDAVNRYTCTCREGYGGLMCATDCNPIPIVINSTLNPEQIHLIYENQAYCLSTEEPAQNGIVVTMEICEEEISSRSKQLFVLTSSKLVHYVSGLCVTKSAQGNNLELGDCLYSDTWLKETMDQEEFRLISEPNTECMELHMSVDGSESFQYDNCEVVRTKRKQYFTSTSLPEFNSGYKGFYNCMQHYSQEGYDEIHATIPNYRNNFCQVPFLMAPEDSNIDYTLSVDFKVIQGSVSHPGIIINWHDHCNYDAICIRGHVPFGFSTNIRNDLRAVINFPTDELEVLGSWMNLKVSVSNDGIYVEVNGNRYNVSGVSPTGYRGLVGFGSLNGWNEITQYTNFNLILHKHYWCHPPQLEDYYIINCDTVSKIGTTCDVTCVYGYKLFAEQSIECLVTGKWTAHTHTCEFIECETMEQDGRGTWDNDCVNTIPTYEKNCTLSCDTGYHLEDPERGTLVCGYESVYDHVHTMCKIDECEDLIEDLHGFWNQLCIGRNPTYLDVCELRCDIGYHLLNQDESVIHCEATGVYNISHTVCEIDECDLLSRDPDGFWNDECDNVKATYQTVCFLTCNTGHYLISPENKNVQCEAGGVFNATNTSCEIYRCDKITPDPHAVWDDNCLSVNSTYDMTCNWLCDVGWHFNQGQEGSIYCNEIGEFEEPVIPVCEIYRCNKITQDPHAVWDDNCVSVNSTYDMTCNLLCDVGWNFNLTREASVYCNEIGEFREPVIPVCEIDECEDLIDDQHGFWNQLCIGRKPTYLDVCELRCDIGYHLLNQNESVIRCEATGIYNMNHTVCEIDECDLLAQDPDGFWNEECDDVQATYLTTCFLTCNIGHFLISPENGTIRCEAGGVFNATKTSCEIYRCDRITPDPHAVWDDNCVSVNSTYDMTCNLLCDIGWHLNLTREGSVYCNEIGEFTETAIPVCEIVDCVEPPIVDNATLAIDPGYYTFGANLKHECDIGYEQDSGNMQRQCLQLEVWSGTPGTCKRIECSIPPIVLYANVLQDTGHVYQSVLEYECEVGYELLIGKFNLECEHTKEWSARFPICRIINCGSIPSVSNTIVTVSLLSFLSIVYYDCDPDYKWNHMGNLERHCLEDKIWNGSSPVCIIRECGNPPFIRNTISSVMGTIVHDIVTYQCEAGNKYEYGDVALICERSEQWIGEPMYCREIICPLPPALPHTSYQLTGNKLDSKATYFCNIGYQPLNGTGVSYCLEREEWSLATLECEVKDCGEPSPIQFGYYNASQTKVNYTATYKCNYGFELTGPKSGSQCLPAGVWEAVTLIQCQPVQCEEPDFYEEYHSVISNITGTSFQDSLNLECIIGHIYNSGDSQLTCGIDRTWQGIPMMCDAITCPVPEEIDNGQMHFTSVEYLSNVTYNCIEGFELAQGNRRICLETKTWSAALPECIEISCGEFQLGNETHLQVTQTDSHYGDTLILNCETGYVMTDGENSAVFECDLNGQWIGIIPTCNLIFCPDPPNVVHAHINYTSTSHGSVVQYTCHYGYELIEGSPFISCSFGVWEGEEPKCALKHCPEPEIVANAEIEIDELLVVGSIVNYTCLPGFNIGAGNSTMTCLHSGQWDGKPRSCSKQQCENPPNINNTIWSLDQNSIEQRAMYACHPNYRLANGSVEKTCLFRSWSGDDPVCILKDGSQESPEDSSDAAILTEIKTGYKEADTKVDNIVAGSIGIFFIVGIVFGVLALDAITIKKDLRKLKNNLRRAYKTIKEPKNKTVADIIESTEGWVKQLENPH